MANNNAVEQIKDVLDAPFEFYGLSAAEKAMLEAVREGKPKAEVAEAHGISRVTIYRRLDKALAKINEAEGTDFEVDDLNRFVLWRIRQIVENGG